MKGARWVLLGLLLGACRGSTTGATPNEGTRLPPDVRPTSYVLRLAVDPSRAGYSGEVEIEVDLPSSTSSILLHAQAMTVSRVEVEVAGSSTQGQLRSLSEDGLARIMTDQPVGPGLVKLHMDFEAAFETTDRALFRVEAGGEQHVFSQMEPLDARRVFPCFDEPQFKTPFSVTLTVREGDVAIANGRELGSEPAGPGMRRVRFAQTQPLPTYLVAILVGPFDIVEAPPIPANAVRASPLPLRAVAPRGEGPKLARALAHTPAVVQWLEDYFGLAYPYDKLDLVTVPAWDGAMENAGAITFGARYILLDEDPPVEQLRDFAYLLVHELAHQWFGNLVTMQWWDDLWLNEAFAMWTETRAVGATFADMDPEITAMEQAIVAMNSDSLGSARRIREPIESKHDVQNAFDIITYLKGQAVLSMLEQFVGPEVFRRGVQQHLRAHAQRNATSEQLLGAISAVAGRDVRGPVQSFINQPGVPLLELSPACEAGVGSLVLRQSRYVPLGAKGGAEGRWQLPYCVRYAVGGELKQACAVLEEEQGRLSLEGGCPDWVFPNAGGHGYYRFSLPGPALEALRLRGLSSLEVRELMALADSVRASFAAGRTSYADALGVLTPLADRPERVLATAPIGLIELALRHLLDEDGRVRARRWAADRYRAAWKRLGWRGANDEPADTRILRKELASFLALEVEDSALRREAGELGRAYLGLGVDEKLHPELLAPDLVSTCVAVAVAQGGAPVFERVLSLLRAESDSIVRGSLLAGLARGATEAKSIERLFAETLDQNGGLELDEIFVPFEEQSKTAAGRQAVSAWVRANYDGLASRLGPLRARYLPYTSAGACTNAAADEVQAFFAPRMEATEGGPRNLAQVVEGIRICAARALHGRASAARLF